MTPLDSAVELKEPAIWPDGLTLYAVSESGGPVKFTRDSYPGPWEAGQPADMVLHQDPCFFEGAQGIVYLLRSESLSVGNPRRLFLHAPPYTVGHELTIVDSSGQLLADDMDGPSVAYNDPARLLMVFNVMTGVEDSTDIWLGQPTGTDLIGLTSWQAYSLAALNELDYKDDDPAISPDGRVIVFSQSQDNISAGILMVSYRLSAGDAPDYSTPEPLSNDPSFQGYAPLLYSQPASSDSSDSLELYFSSRAGEMKILQVDCHLEG